MKINIILGFNGEKYRRLGGWGEDGKRICLGIICDMIYDMLYDDVMIYDMT